MRYEASGRTTERHSIGIFVLPLVAAAVVASALLGASFGEAEPVAPPSVDVDCTDMPLPDCQRAVDAAQLALGHDGPPPRTAIVSTSMICGDDLDCPRWFLRDSRSIGSVRLSFDDPSLQAWVNVVDLNAPGGDAEPSFVGLVIRWVERS